MIYSSVVVYQGKIKKMRNKWSSTKKRQKHSTKLRKNKRKEPETIETTAVEDGNEAEAVDVVSVEDGPEAVAAIVVEDEAADDEHELEAIEITVVEDEEAEAAPSDDESE